MILVLIQISIIWLITFGLSLKMVQYFKKDINPMQVITPKIESNLFEKMKSNDKRQEKYNSIMERG